MNVVVRIIDVPPAMNGHHVVAGRNIEGWPSAECLCGWTVEGCQDRADALREARAHIAKMPARPHLGLVK